MRMGARWVAGEAPHGGVPADLHPAIQEQEGVYPDADSWTLTWLEGRPRLVLDDLVEISIDASGATVVRAASGTLAAPAADGGGPAAPPNDDDDDDDWLS
ncbi:Fe-S oxidoreductase [Leucobacter rhizosphaerae]|uniref:Fe-S oxidoreductase n=1 Tax=Leucobacter rhizosphaerae TaxID=2932245 RepID=A0ABY4FXA0_9MICO|nr:Fe-S oxidoreductase [Leucobacter rhizosphaerae]UOQ60935.1 Fe-S oxidoreductase [Leucobacter rhizosphaerae]